MKIMAQLMAIWFLVIMLTGLISAPTIYATTGSCYLQASRTDVFVVLNELNRDGQQGPVIWAGRINEGQKVLVTVPHARFRMYYNDQPDVNQPMSGGNDRYCDSKRVVGVP